MSEVIDIFPGNLDSSLCLLHPAQHFSWCTLHISYISMVTIYNFDLLLSQLRNQSVLPSPVLTVASWSACRFLRKQVRWSGIPISWRIFQVCCDPPSQRLQCNQWSRCFSGTLMLFLWSNRLISSSSAFWFEHLEILCSCTVEAWLGKFWALLS